MYRAKLLLDLLTKYIPPGDKQRHNLTVNEKGLEVTLMLGDRYVPILLENVDFDLPVRDLVAIIQNELEGIKFGELIKNSDKRKR